MKTLFPRAAYLPTDRKVRIRQHDDVPAMIAMYDTNGGRTVALAWRGKAQKPALHYSFRSHCRAEKYVREWLADQRESAAAKARARAANNGPHSLRVGQVLYSSWGYDQTNIDWYEVTKILGKRYVEIRPISSVAVGEQGGPQQGTAPAVGKYTGEPMRKAAGFDNSIRIASYAFAHPWDGEPQQETGHGWGH